MVRAFSYYSTGRGTGPRSENVAQSLPTAGAYASPRGMDQRVSDEDRMGRCGTRSNRDHAALEYLSSEVHDIFVPRCVIRGCSEVAMVPEIRIQFCCVGIESGLISFKKSLGDATM